VRCEQALVEMQVSFPMTEEVVWEIAVRVFGAQRGSLAGLRAMAGTCKAFRFVLREERFLERLVSMRGWTSDGEPTMKRLLQRNTMPFCKGGEKMLCMDVHTELVHADVAWGLFGTCIAPGSGRRVLFRLSNKAWWHMEAHELLWMGSTTGKSRYLLCAFAGERGLHVFLKEDLTPLGPVLPAACKWGEAPWQMPHDRATHVYKTEGGILKRARVDDEALARYVETGERGAWEEVNVLEPEAAVWVGQCSLPQGPASLVMTEGHVGLLPFGDGHRKFVARGVERLKLMSEVEMCAFDGCTVGAAVRWHNGTVTFVDVVSLRETRLLPGGEAEEGWVCHMVRARGTMVAMLVRTGADWTVVVKDVGAEGWMRQRRVRGRLTDMQWLEAHGKLVGCMEKALFII
jgi:hypothetical protein